MRTSSVHLYGMVKARKPKPAALPNISDDLRDLSERMRVMAIRLSRCGPVAGLHSLELAGAAGVVEQWSKPRKVGKHDNEATATGAPGSLE